MIDVKKLEKDFIERRGDNPPENLMAFTYKTKSGSGAMVIDMDKLNKLPKSKQNKIMKLAEGK